MELTGTWRAAVADDDLRRTWHEDGFDDDSWEPLSVPGHWRSSSAFSDADGPLLYRRSTYSDINPDLAPMDLTATPLEALFNQFYIDESRLRRHVAALLEQKGAVTLVEVTAVYPLTQGLAELVTYIAIAAGDETHQIDKTAWEEIELVENGRVIRLPRITFKK